DGTPSWLLRSRLLRTVRIRVTPIGAGSHRFVGITPSDAEERYLHAVRRAEITNFDDASVAPTDQGGAPATRPAKARTWAASSSGRGTRTIRWDLRDGSWSVVVMNADGGPGVYVDANVGATVPSLIWIASGLLIAGGVFLALGIVLILVGIRQPKLRT